MMSPRNESPADVITGRLRGLGRRLRFYALLDGLALVACSLLLLAGATLVIDRTFRLDRDMRVVQLVSVLAIVAVVARRGLVALPVWRVRTKDLAIVVERRHPGLQSRLVTAVEAAGALAEPGPGACGVARSSPAMIRQVCSEAAQALSGLRLVDLLAHERAVRGGLLIVGCLGACLAAQLAAPATVAVWAQRNLLLREIPWPTRNRLVVENLVDGRLIVARDDDLTVTARVDHGQEPPRQAFIEYLPPGGTTRRAQMPAIGRERLRFTHTFERLAGDLTCRVVGGDAVTEWFTVQVVDRPSPASLGVRIFPPVYTGQEPYELREGQTVAEVLRGSTVEFVFTCTQPLSRAQLACREESSGEVRTLDAGLEEGVYRVRDRPAVETAYDLILRGTNGIENSGPRVTPPRLLIRPVPDEPPEARLRLRGAGELITPAAVLPLEVSFSDQHGLASAAVAHATAREGQEGPFVAEALADVAPGTRSLTRTLEWHVDAHGLVPGDRLRLKATAADLDDVAGPNVGESPVVSLRVATREDVLADLGRRQGEHRHDLERLLRAQENLYNELLRVFAGPTPPDENAVQALVRRQRDAARRVEVLRQQFEQVLAEFRVNRLDVPETERRLGNGVVEPLARLARQTMPQAAADIQRRAGDAGADRDIRQSQERVLAELNAVLSGLSDWESYNEAVILLRDVLRMQGELKADVERRIRTDILGFDPADAPATSSPAPGTR